MIVAHIVAFPATVIASLFWLFVVAMIASLFRIFMIVAKIAFPEVPSLVYYSPKERRKNYVVSE